MTLGQSKALNSGRAILVLGVIVYHTARVFDTSPFYVKTQVPLETLAPVVLFGTLAGMPLFFSFAGFSLWHSLGARGARAFFRERVFRLLVPFLAGIVLLVPMQIFAERRLSGENVSYLHSMAQFLDVHLVARFPLPIAGTWFDPAHLWFLGYLFAFTVLLLPALVWMQRRERLPEASDRGAVAIWVAAALAIAAIEALLGTEALGGWNRWSYLVFLLLGVSAATQPAVSTLMARRWRSTFAIAMASFVALAAACMALHGPFDESLTTGTSLAPTLWRAGKALTVILILMAVVGSVAAVEEAPKRRGRFAGVLSRLEPISLPLYIVHQSVLVVLAAWIVKWSVPVSMQWLALVVLTVGLSFICVELSARTRFGRLMLGLKPGRHTPVSAPAQLRPEGARELGTLPS